MSGSGKSAPDLRIQDRVKRPSGDHDLAIYREFGAPIVNLRMGDKPSTWIW